MATRELLAETRQVDEALDALLADHARHGWSAQEFLAARYDRGLAWVHFPIGQGGLGLDPQLQRHVEARLREADAPDPTERSPLAYGMAGPTIQAWGTDEQRARYLRPLFTGEEAWCQLFSEPGAGSDLAALATRAVRDGDMWVVNGQKVWSTLAHEAAFGLLLARTDPSAPKHRGITYFILPMRTPGVDVRPLRQLTGDAEFNEVFLEDVRIPDTCRLGEVNDGWRVATATLTNERATLGGSSTALPGADLVDRALELWRKGGRATEGPVGRVRRDQLMSLWCQAQVLRLLGLRAEHLQAAGQESPHGSLTKLLRTRVTQGTSAFMLHLLGAEGTLHPTGYRFERPAYADHFENPQQYFLRSRSHSIGGGTSEVQRNIIGERLLGLPREVSVDKDVPWNQIQRRAVAGRSASQRGGA